ncbi:MAG: conserved hypothetical protein [Candidatus Desulfovibrio kirbyi]|uniref:Uncharacterized protein n=1 Tax=Candidatus Desulfovibrio kirbyi TaxID=2696086 RepID=A0A6L2R6T3_9BACT|nr:MAG: conserved hypothetical protein [Candidatus Desulfovibrio kirbyi]
MNRNREILIGSLCITLLAVALCVWNVFGNDVTICITAGCSLYQDFILGGISLWWLGAGVFSVLSLLALAGAATLGRSLAALALFGDVCLLLLMALTAPCVSCLVIAIFFALTYLSFRRAHFRQAHISQTVLPRSVLLWVWIALFTVNVGAVIRSQSAPWPIVEAGDNTTVRVFFSPSCPRCRDAVAILSGHVEVAFYPLAETESDTYKVAHMLRLLQTGANMAEALAGAQNAELLQGIAAWAPAMIWLRFRMLRNKAHIFSAGSQTVPFFEYHGMPDMLMRQSKPPPPCGDNRSQNTQDSTLPGELVLDNSCGANTPCLQ